MLAAGALAARLLAPVLDSLALATDNAVAQIWLVAFVGLAAPHPVRLLVRSSHGALVFLARLKGGVLLMLPICWPAGWPRRRNCRSEY